MAGELVAMSATELDRLEVVRRVLEGRLSQVEAGALLGLTTRQVRRLCSAFELEGPAGLVSRQRGRPSNNRLPATLQEQVLALPQRDLVLLVRFVEPGRYALDVFNLRTRRLVTLTDWLHWAPQLALGLADESCGRPWVTRAAGGGEETLTAPSSTLHFLEYRPEAGAASLLVMPIDLLSPPRELVQTIPIYCHAPLVSLDGRQVVALIDG